MIDVLGDGNRASHDRYTVERKADNERWLAHAFAQARSLLSRQGPETVANSGRSCEDGATRRKTRRSSWPPDGIRRKAQPANEGMETVSFHCVTFPLPGSQSQGLCKVASDGLTGGLGGAGLPRVARSGRRSRCAGERRLLPARRWRPGRARTTALDHYCRSSPGRDDSVGPSLSSGRQHPLLCCRRRRTRSQACAEVISPNHPNRPTWDPCRWKCKDPRRKAQPANEGNSSCATSARNLGRARLSGCGGGVPVLAVRGVRPRWRSRSPMLGRSAAAAAIARSCRPRPDGIGAGVARGYGSVRVCLAELYRIVIRC